MKRIVFVDANIIIRFFLGDHPLLSAQAQTMIEKAQNGQYRIYLDEVVVAEVVWTLSSYYEKGKVDIANQIGKLLSQNWIINPRKKLILKSLSLFEKTNLSYIDCWIHIINQHLKTDLATFDKNLKKLI